MQDLGIFDAIPLWAVFVGTMLLVILAVGGGYHWAARKHRAAVEKEAPVGTMVGTLLGLLAFLLAFTFGWAADRYHDRKIALLDEVNAIRASHWQAAMIPEPQRTEVRKLLRNYVEERLQWSGLQKVRVSLTSRALLDRLAAQAAFVGAQNPGGVDVFLGSVSDVIGLHTKREMLRDRSQIPGAFWVTLYLVAILSIAAMGYHGGVAGTAKSPVMLAVAIAFSMVILLIADLDRPGEGFINVSQQPMIDLRDWLSESKP